METRTRKPAAVRREEIARAVLRILGERGLGSLTAATLAEEVGVTSGALFRHFDSRDAILQEAVRHAVLRIEATFPEASLPPLVRLLEMARNRVRLLGSEPGLAWLMRSEQAFLALPEGAAWRLRELVECSKRFVLDAIREGAARGDIRSDIEPEVLLVFVLGTIHALVGTSGFHQPAMIGRGRDAERVLAALECLLAPPGSAQPVERGRSQAARRRRSNRR